ncbi:peptidylprolyl isomerase [Saccharothrix australiensis]|uniref:Peptidyl-prolyl cis-trans isomerase B (Cyclophilin B) n=1 Tax=Saccharothrix australiensis TaxID=2072 RepID=A0A495VXF6_9PSEU|nr:peptidylprolyl isomerase [Saccharothrix australiensis]RKT53939.1 peptidyl-prolyl cis-trans isomerase B (cyclophilin B) [Saccharothrix australiensis]
MARRLLSTAVVVLLTSGCAQPVPGRPVAGPLPPVPTTHCEYTRDPEATTTTRVTAPSDDGVPAEGRTALTVKTTRGDLELTLDAASAPCSVHNFRHLVEQRFYEGHSCHRLVTEGIWLIQCGDPTGTGVGGPGYKYDDPEAAEADYTRGVIGMANRGTPGTNGSQFFIVYRDSAFPPNFPVIGEVTRGLDVIDKVAAEGVRPESGLGPTDGLPRLDLKFTKVEEK